MRLGCGQNQHRTMNLPLQHPMRIAIFYDKPICLGCCVGGGAIKPDIVVWDRNGLNRAEHETHYKYQDSKNEPRMTWALKNIELIPVVVGTTGLVKITNRPLL